jgi:hypothetical protein
VLAASGGVDASFVGSGLVDASGDLDGWPGVTDASDADGTFCVVTMAASAVLASVRAGSAASVLPAASRLAVGVSVLVACSDEVAAPVFGALGSVSKLQPTSKAIPTNVNQRMAPLGYAARISPIV